MGCNYEWVVPILTTWVVAMTSWQCTNSGNSDGGHYDWAKPGHPCCQNMRCWCHFEQILAKAAQVTTNKDFDYIQNNFWPRLPKLPTCKNLEAFLAVSGSMPPKWLGCPSSCTVWTKVLTISGPSRGQLGLMMCSENERFWAGAALSCDHGVDANFNF
jgi:hypothetical protein